MVFSWKHETHMFVCGYFFYKGNIRLAILVAFCPYPVQTLLGIGYFSKSSLCICTVAFGSGTQRRCFFPYVAWPSHTRAVNLWAVACVHTCTELLCKRWLLAGVVQNVCLLEQQPWVLSLPCLSPGAWEQVTRDGPTAPCAHPTSTSRAFLGILTPLPASVEPREPRRSSCCAAGEQISLQGWSPLGFQYCI